MKCKVSPILPGDLCLRRETCSYSGTGCMCFIRVSLRSCKGCQRGEHFKEVLGPLCVELGPAWCDRTLLDPSKVESFGSEVWMSAVCTPCHKESPPHSHPKSYLKVHVRVHITLLLTTLRVLITLLLATHEPPSMLESILAKPYNLNLAQELPIRYAQRTLGQQPSGFQSRAVVLVYVATPNPVILRASHPATTARNPRFLCLCECLAG